MVTGWGVDPMDLWYGFEQLENILAKDFARTVHPMTSKSRVYKSFAYDLGMLLKSSLRISGTMVRTTPHSHTISIPHSQNVTLYGKCMGRTKVIPCHPLWVSQLSIHSWKLTCNLKMMVSKSNLPFQEPVFKFHLSFLVCISNRVSWWTFF